MPGADARSWSFRFAGGAADRTASATLRCVRLSLPRRVRGVGLAVGTVIEPVFGLGSGATQEVAITCPRGQVPTGWGLERTDDANGLAIAIASPTARGWTFTVENTGAAGAAGSLHARCLERKQRASTGQRHAFSTRVASFSEALSGNATMSHACRASEYSVATGVSLAAATDVVLTAHEPSRRP